MAENINEKPNGQLRVGDNSLELPRVPASCGEDGVHIGAMRTATGVVALDPGFNSTASCNSKITFIDGDKGILRYRGYPIEQLAERSSFLEVCYLLIHGELPTAKELKAFSERIHENRLLHEDFKSFFTAFPAHGHPMSVLQGGIVGMSTYYEYSTKNVLDPQQQEEQAILLLAKVPTMIAYTAKRAAGLPLLYPDASRSYTEDFLRMTFGLPYQSYDIDPEIVHALDMLFILHADHEQNCSTSTVRMVGSAQANMYASVASGVGALSGPLHGGANEAVLDMLNMMRDTGMTVKEFVNKVKNKEDGVKLMGFGHRVYKNYDPRAAIVRDTAHTVLKRLGASEVSEMLDMAMELEEVALKDEYFVKRRLYPNVDFYTGLIYTAMGFKTKMFTPLFALGRLPGWIAQYIEMLNDPATKIGRPRQVYDGEVLRDYIPVRERGKN
ncbi:MAG: citrate synthase [Actinomycetaceae bacterium]|nr:citrate synthase [Actinomycetaceae bacterium]